MPSLRRLAIVLTIVALTGCERAPTPGRPARRSPAPPPGAPATLPLFRPIVAGREDLPAVVDANNAFALALYHKLRTRPGNLLVSPACLSAGLAVLHSGARGETARQMARVLHLPDDLARPDRAFAALIQDLNADAEDFSYQIRLANALWIQEGYPRIDSYRATLRDVFATEGNPVDFTGHPEDACRVINAWTESRTGGKISAMLRPADLHPRTRMALTSGLYFRANWREFFAKEVTRPAEFRVATGETIEVPMMNQHSYSLVHRYYDGGSFQALGLPCGSGEEFEMQVLLPREVDGLTDLEASLTPEALGLWGARLRNPEEIIIGLPKFRIRADLSLDRVLSELGMPLAFDGRADFSGINGKAGDLFLSSARHATFLDVHEEGIEAAAAMSVTSPDAFGEEPPVFLRRPPVHVPDPRYPIWLHHISRQGHEPVAADLRDVKAAGSVRVPREAMPRPPRSGVWHHLDVLIVFENSNDSILCPRGRLRVPRPKRHQNPDRSGLRLWFRRLDSLLILQRTSDIFRVRESAVQENLDPSPRLRLDLTDPDSCPYGVVFRGSQPGNHQDLPPFRGSERGRRVS